MDKLREELEEMVGSKISAVYTIKENVVSNDELYKFNNGAYALLWWTYANEWSDKPHAIIFPNVEEALDFYRGALGDRLGDALAQESEARGKKVDVVTWMYDVYDYFN